MTRRLLGVGIAALACACMPRQGGDQGDVKAGSQELAAAGQQSCGVAPESAIAILESQSADECGVTLELGEGQLVVRTIPLVGEGLLGAAGVGEVVASGPIPEECGAALEHCELWGVFDELGPILLAAVRGPESEVPVQVFVGWVEGERLAFAPTWYGLSSVADHTQVGPAWALAPHACDGRLVLLPAARLPEAAVEEASEAVRAAAGYWTIAADGPAMPSEARTDASGCRPVFASLP